MEAAHNAQVANVKLSFLRCAENKKPLFHYTALSSSTSQDCLQSLKLTLSESTQMLVVLSSPELQFEKHSVITGCHKISTFPYNDKSPKKLKRNLNSANFTAEEYVVHCWVLLVSLQRS